MLRRVGPDSDLEEIINIINTNNRAIDTRLKELVTNPFKFHAYRNTTQAVTTSIWTQVQLATKNFDTNNNFSTSTYKYTVPVTGYYQLTGQVYGTAVDGVYTIVQIAKNTTGTNASGNGGTALAEARDTDTASNNKVVSCSTLAYLEAGETVSLVAYITDSTSPTIGAGIGNTFLSGFLVSQ
jgi:hypothetical protein